MPDSTPFIVFAFECRVVGSNRATEVYDLVVMPAQQDDPNRRGHGSLIPSRSHGASVKSCFTPKYRSVVVIDACPKLNWICSSCALPLCASFANVRRRS